MRQLQLTDHLSDAALRQMLQASRNTAEFARWQILYLIQVEHIGTADVIASLVGLSRPSVYALVQKYNRNGPTSVALRPRGGRRHSLLSEDDEKELMASLLDLATRGLVKTVLDIKGLVEQKVGKVVSEDYLWDLFKRHGWKKKFPRVSQVRKKEIDPKVADKRSRSGWQPSGY